MLKLCKKSKLRTNWSFLIQHVSPKHAGLYASIYLETLEEPGVDHEVSDGKGIEEEWTAGFILNMFSYHS